MRGLYRTGPDGSYAIRTVAPIGYTIPMDGTVGELMQRTASVHIRPAHIHFAGRRAGLRSVSPSIPARRSNISTPMCVGVKEKLIVEFERHASGQAPTGERLDTPFAVVRYDFVLKQAEPAVRLRSAAAS